MSSVGFDELKRLERTEAQMEADFSMEEAQRMERFREITQWQRPIGAMPPETLVMFLEDHFDVPSELEYLGRLHDDWLYCLDIEPDLIDPLHRFMQSMVSGQVKKEYEVEHD